MDYERSDSHPLAAIGTGLRTVLDVAAHSANGKRAGDHTASKGGNTQPAAKRPRRMGERPPLLFRSSTDMMAETTSTPMASFRPEKTAPKLSISKSRRGDLCVESESGVSGKVVAGRMVLNVPGCISALEIGTTAECLLSMMALVEMNALGSSMLTAQHEQETARLQAKVAQLQRALAQGCEVMGAWQPAAQANREGTGQSVRWGKCGCSRSIPFQSKAMVPPHSLRDFSLLNTRKG